MSEPKKATPRVREHVDRLRAAGLDTQKFYDALVALRDDTGLPRTHREAIYRLIAMESFIWYMEALRNEPIDRNKLREDAQKLAESRGGVLQASKSVDAQRAQANAAMAEPAPKGPPGAPPHIRPATAKPSAPPPKAAAGPKPSSPAAVPRKK